MIVFKTTNPEIDRQVVYTEESLLWSARMCVGEGGFKCTREEASVIMYAILNRYLLHPAVPKWVNMAVKYGAIPKKGDPYIGVLRMFSQPVNPRWALGGDKAIKYRGTKFATPARLGRRARISNLDWAEIPQKIQNAVRDFAAVDIEVPSRVKALPKNRVSDWASLPSTPKRFPWGIGFRKNWFFENRALLPGNPQALFFLHGSLSKVPRSSI